MSCPNCNGTDWKLASLVHAEGTAQHESTGNGLGVGVSASGLTVAGGTSATKGTQQTRLAQLAAPPRPPTEAWQGGIAVLLLGIVLGWWFSWWWLGLSALGLAGCFADDTQAKTRYSEALAKWERTRVCQRCGTFYDALATLPAATHTGS